MLRYSKAISLNIYGSEEFTLTSSERIGTLCLLFSKMSGEVGIIVAKRILKYLREIGLTPTLYVVAPKTEKIEYQFVGYVNREGVLKLLKGK